MRSRTSRRSAATTRARLDIGFTAVALERPAARGHDGRVPPALLQTAGAACLEMRPQQMLEGLRQGRLDLGPDLDLRRAGVRTRSSGSRLFSVAMHPRLGARRPSAAARAQAASRCWMPTGAVLDPVDDPFSAVGYPVAHAPGLEDAAAHGAERCVQPAGPAARYADRASVSVARTRCSNGAGPLRLSGDAARAAARSRDELPDFEVYPGLPLGRPDERRCAHGSSRRRRATIAHQLGAARGARAARRAQQGRRIRPKEIRRCLGPSSWIWPRHRPSSAACRR